MQVNGENLEESRDKEGLAEAPGGTEAGEKLMTVSPEVAERPAQIGPAVIYLPDRTGRGRNNSL